MEVTIGQGRVAARAIDVARMVAATYGYDVDLEPMGPYTRLTAKRGDETIRINGANQKDVCESFVNQMIGVKDA